MGFKHGKYVLFSKKGEFYIFDTKFRKGRALRKNKPDMDFTYKTHPKAVKTIITKGEWSPSIVTKGEWSPSRKSKGGK